MKSEDFKQNSVRHNTHPQDTTTHTTKLTQRHARQPWSSFQFRDWWRRRARWGPRCKPRQWHFEDFYVKHPTPEVKFTFHSHDKYRKSWMSYVTKIIIIQRRRPWTPNATKVSLIHSTSWVSSASTQDHYSAPKFENVRQQNSTEIRRTNLVKKISEHDWKKEKQAYALKDRKSENK